MRHITSTARSFCDGQKDSDPKCPPMLLLMLSKMCLEFKNTSVHYLVSFKAITSYFINSKVVWDYFKKLIKPVR